MLFSRQIFNFLANKHVKKILKRKDSDAGETGRVLEDVRASLLSRFRLSDNSKRQQQHTFGPVAALIFNFVVAVGIIFINKWVLQGVGFHFPICLSFIHYLTSWVLMAILKALSILSTSHPTKTTRLTLFTLGFVMCLSTGLANVSLKYNSVGFYQMAKIAVTPSIVLAEFIWFRKRVSFLKVVALTIASVGVGVATINDLQLSVFGACISIAWIIPSAVNKILWSSLQQRENWTALALMWKTTPITLFFLAVLAPFLDPQGMLSYDWSFKNSSLILLSAILGFLLQWSGALALGATSAVSHVVLGQFKTCVVLLGSYYLVGANPGETSIYGAMVALAGMFYYAYLNIIGITKSQPGKVSRNVTSLPNLKLSKEAEKGHNVYADEVV